MSNSCVHCLRRRAHWLRLGGILMTTLMGVFTWGAWHVDRTFVAECALTAAFLGVFAWDFLATSNRLYARAARLRARNTALARLQRPRDDQ
jgi:hypothetical protein